MAEKIIAACGNDCSVCLRYNKEPFAKSAEELAHTAELWYKIGYRDRIVSNDEISCQGCSRDNWCRYNVVKCDHEKKINHCGQCNDYPCNNIKECFAVTSSFEPKCKEVCTEDEYEILKRAFFEKKQNLTSNTTR